MEKNRIERRVPTVTLERHVLHYLLSDKTFLQGRLLSCDREWFTSPERDEIFSIVEKSFAESKKPVSRTQFEYLLELSLPDASNASRRELVTAEYELILSSKPDTEADVVVKRLDEAIATTNVEKLLLEAYGSIEEGNLQGAVQTLKQGVVDISSPDANTRSVSLWDDSADWVAEVVNRRDCPEKYAGIKTGFRKFDDLTGGLFPAELTVVFGLSGKGKSTLMKQIGVNVRRAGYNVLHCGNEENEFQMRTKYTAVETGIKYQHWKRGAFTEAEMMEYEAYRKEQLANGSGKMFIYNFPQQTDATMVARQLAEKKAQGIRIDLCIVDYLDLMSSIKRAYNENDEGGRVTGDLKQLATDFNIPVLVCTQAATTAEKQEYRDKPFLTAADVFGTKRKVHSANTLVGIVNQDATVGAGDRDDELKRHRLVICVPKNRDGPVFTFKVVNEVETGRITDDEDEGIDMSAAESHAMRIMDEASKLEAEQRPSSPSDVSCSIEKEVESILDGIESSATGGGDGEVEEPWDDPFLGEDGTAVAKDMELALQGGELCSDAPDCGKETREEARRFLERWRAKARR